MNFNRMTCKSTPILVTRWLHPNRLLKHCSKVSNASNAGNDKLSSGLTLRVLLIGLLVTTTLTLPSCEGQDDSPEGKYREAVAEGLSRKSLADEELLLGLRLGMNRQAFFDRCTELNQQQLITMGRGGLEAEYLLTEELDRPAVMSFQPVFAAPPAADLITLKMVFNYQDWSPWNKEAHTDKLLPDVADYLGQLLGVILFEFDHPVRGRTYAGASYGRHLSVWSEDDLSVKAEVADLTKLQRDPLGIAQ